MGLPILPLWVTRSSLLFLNFACRQTRQPRWTLTNTTVILLASTPEDTFLSSPLRPAPLAPVPDTHRGSPDHDSWVFPALGLRNVVQSTPPSRDSLFLSRGGSSRIRRSVYWILFLKKKSLQRKSKQIYNATEETRSAKARSRYVRATAMRVKRMFDSKTAAVRFVLHGSLYSVSVFNYCVFGLWLRAVSPSVTWETS